jgi:transcriptional regulator with XRE-family HTH domain
MILLPSARRRPTETVREAARLTDTVAAALGQTVRTGRKRLHLTQAALGSRVGVHQSWISRIELGRGQAVPLELWIRIGVALGQPIAVSLSRPLGVTRQPVDAGHLAMQEYLLGLARTTGRSASFELPTRPSDPSRSVDVCVRDVRHRVLIIEEAWNTFGDLGAAIRATHRKGAEAAELAATTDDGPAYRVATVWVVRDDAINRSIVARYPEVIRSAFPGSSRGWTGALVSGDRPPESAGFVWFDSARRQVHAWKTRSPTRT